MTFTVRQRIYGSAAHYYFVESRRDWLKDIYLCICADKCPYVFATKACISHPARGPPVLRFTGKRGKRLEAKG